ncbi:MAG: hypothetical protein U0790_19455, partial [Isosphaeraceae bacterium]
MSQGGKAKREFRRGEQDVPAALPSYWVATRRPLPSLIFVAPLMLIYEGSLGRLGPTTQSGLRTGADAWLRQSLASL